MAYALGHKLFQRHSLEQQRNRCCKEFRYRNQEQRIRFRILDRKRSLRRNLGRKRFQRRNLDRKLEQCCSNLCRNQHLSRLKDGQEDRQQSSGCKG
jgi:hypothetical protein